MSICEKINHLHLGTLFVFLVRSNTIYQKNYSVSLRVILHKTLKFLSFVIFILFYIKVNIFYVIDKVHLGPSWCLFNKRKFFSEIMDKLDKYLIKKNIAFFIIARTMRSIPIFYKKDKIHNIIHYIQCYGCPYSIYGCQILNRKLQ